ncbi:hypothetical protein [Duncaniella dubosii]|uniref:hypothetical protein n=1 Tax=Duncaniella dubosii TaxID=2518971 RepID=UPI003F670119
MKFKARREKQQAAKTHPGTAPLPKPQRQSQPKPKQPEPIVIPPLPDIVCGIKIDRLKQQAYQEGKFISIGICASGGVVPINHWVWFDFDKREPVMSRTYPSDHKIPEAFLRQHRSKAIPYRHRRVPESAYHRLLSVETFLKNKVSLTTEECRTTSSTSLNCTPA